eukprot:3970909-Pleurochrysis_carterae.AAC.1
MAFHSSHLSSPPRRPCRTDAAAAAAPSSAERPRRCAGAVARTEVACVSGGPTGSDCGGGQCSIREDWGRRWRWLSHWRWHSLWPRCERRVWLALGPAVPFERLGMTSWHLSRLSVAHSCPSKEELYMLWSECTASARQHTAAAAHGMGKLTLQSICLPLGAPTRRLKCPRALEKPCASFWTFPGQSPRGPNASQAVALAMPSSFAKARGGATRCARAPVRMLTLPIRIAQSFDARGDPIERARERGGGGGAHRRHCTRRSGRGGAPARLRVFEHTVTMCACRRASAAEADALVHK